MVVLQVFETFLPNSFGPFLCILRNLISHSISICSFLPVSSKCAWHSFDCSFPLPLYIIYLFMLLNVYWIHVIVAFPVRLSEQLAVVLPTCWFDFQVVPSCSTDYTEYWTILHLNCISTAHSTVFSSSTSSTPPPPLPLPLSTVLLHITLERMYTPFIFPSLSLRFWQTCRLYNLSVR